MYWYNQTDLLRHCGQFCDARCLGRMMPVARPWYAALRSAVDAWPVYRPMDGPTLRRMVDACCSAASMCSAAHVVLSDVGGAAAEEEDPPPSPGGADALSCWEAVVGVVLVARLLTGPRASLRIDLVGPEIQIHPFGRNMPRPMGPSVDTVNAALSVLMRERVLRRVRSFELRLFRQSASIVPNNLAALVHAVVCDPQCRLESLRLHTDAQHWTSACATIEAAWRSLFAFALRNTSGSSSRLEELDLRFERCPRGAGRWFVRDVDGGDGDPAAAEDARLRILRLDLPHGEWDTREGRGLDALFDAVAAQDRLQILHLDLSHTHLRDAWRNHARRPLRARLRSACLVVRAGGLDVRSLRDLLAWILGGGGGGGAGRRGAAETFVVHVDARDNRIDCAASAGTAWAAFPWTTEWGWSSTGGAGRTLTLDLRGNPHPPQNTDTDHHRFPPGVRCLFDPPPTAVNAGGGDPSVTTATRGAYLHVPVSVGDADADDEDDTSVWM